MISELKVILYDDSAIGVIIGDETGLFTPHVAVEIACSLIEAAKEVDPTLDVNKVMKDYRDVRGLSDEVH